MESIDKLRDELIEEVSRAKVNQPGVAAAVDRYAPQLHRIIQSIDASVSRLAGRLTALAFLVLPIDVVIWSLLGAVILNMIITINHRRDRYVARS